MCDTPPEFVHICIFSPFVNIKKRKNYSYQVESEAGHGKRIIRYQSHRKKLQVKESFTKNHSKGKGNNK
jgi:predicted GNAT family acetyltransferase